MALERYQGEGETTERSVAQTAVPAPAGGKQGAGGRDGGGVREAKHPLGGKLASVGISELSPRLIKDSKPEKPGSGEKIKTPFGLAPCLPLSLSNPPGPAP